MNKENMKSILQELDEFDERVRKIALVDIETYEQYRDRLLAVRNDMFELEEQDGISNHETEIIYKLENISFDFNNYILGRNLDAELLLPGENSTQKNSGDKKIREHRMKLYKDIFANFEKQPKIDIERLKELRQRWNEESETGYTPVEIASIDDLMAKAFVRYQKESIAKTGKLPVEDPSEFCSQARYKAIVSKELLDKIMQMEKGSPERTDLEYLYTSLSEEELCKDLRVWKALTGTNVRKQEVAEIVPKESTQSTALVPTKNKEVVVYDIENDEPRPYKPAPDGQVLVTLREYKRKYGIVGPKIATERDILVPLEKSNNGEPRVFLNKLQYPSGGASYKPYKNKQIVYISFPSNITEFYPETVYGYSNSGWEKEYTMGKFPYLEQVDFSDKLNKIGKMSFWGSSIKYMRIPRQCRIIGENAFQYCKNLKSVEWVHDFNTQDYITIGPSAFKNCGSLQDFSINKLGMSKCNGVLINEGAFEECEKLKKFPFEDVIHIDTEAFKGCKNLMVGEKLRMPKLEPVNSDEMLMYNVTYTKEDLINSRLGKKVRRFCSIMPRAFESSGIEELEYPENFDKITGGCVGIFKDCRNLKKIYSPNVIPNFKYFDRCDQPITIYVSKELLDRIKEEKPEVPNNWTFEETPQKEESFEERIEVAPEELAPLTHEQKGDKELEEKQQEYKS